MRILIHENPLEHGNRITPALLDYLGENNVIESTDFQDTESTLRNKEVDYVVIHHTSLHEIEILKRNYPHVKYIAYSGTIGACWTGLNQDMANKLRRIYDKIIDSPSDILEKIKELEQERLRK